MPQILSADLLAQRLWDGQPLSPDTFPTLADKVNFLALHALESGGSQLTKTNIFYGVHIFFSGGAVATFSFYESKGDVKCSGFAYNYRGNVREKNYANALHAGPAHDAIVDTDVPCSSAPPGLPPSRAIVANTTTKDQVSSRYGSPDGGSTLDTFRYKALGMVIHFTGNTVSRVEYK